VPCPERSTEFNVVEQEVLENICAGNIGSNRKMEKIA
jgi:hypothetical protein